MMKWQLSTALATVGLALGAPAFAKSDVNPNELLSMSLAELSNIEVTSVSKKSEKASEAAAAIYVITQDDIHHSGLTSIPELLRMVPGLHVAQSGSHQWSVSSRGLSGQFADTLLVLIDGRSVYTPIYSGVYWDAQDTPLEDIERIEVIRGPGATLWGANAVNGVINIITKNSKDTQGGYASQAVGSALRSQTTARYGAKMGDNGHARVYAKYDENEEFRNMTGGGAGDAWNRSQGGFRSDWSKDSNRYTLQGDMYRAGEDAQLKLIQPSGATSATDVRGRISGANILGRWDHKASSTSEFTVQMYYDLARRNDYVYRDDVQTFDLDMQHVWTPMEGHEVVWGGGYRMIKSEFNNIADNALGIPYIQLFPTNQDKRLLSGFVQDKITLIPKDWFLTLGSKFEHNAFTGFEYQPSARLSWIVDDKQTLWSSVSRSVRTPNIGSTSNLQQIAAPVAPTVFYTQVGNPSAKSIDMTAYEAGYRIQPQDNVSIDTSVFLNNYDNMILGQAGTPYTVGIYTLVPISPENLGSAKTWGIETTTKWNPASWAELTGSYTLLKMNFDQLDPLGYNFRDRSPQQQFNARATFFMPYDVELTTSAYYVDQLAAADLNTAEDVSGYMRFDTRLAWKPMDSLELSLVGQNLLDDEHQEYYGFAYQNSSQIPRSVYGNISVKF